VDRAKKKLADENRHNNRWAQAQQMSNCQPMTFHAPRSTLRMPLRPSNSREMLIEGEEEIEADI